MASVFTGEELLSEDAALSDLKVSPDSTFLIFDWDDTLLPTSWLLEHNLTLETPFIKEKESRELEELDLVVSGILRRAIVLYGRVMIITNAQQGWVELSARKFLPETYDLIFTSDINSTASSAKSYSSSSSDFQPNQRNFTKAGTKRTRDGEVKGGSTQTKDDYESDSMGRITVYSSRNLFEKDFPNNPSAWKEHAFQKLLWSRIPSQFFVHGTRVTEAHSDTEMEVDGGELDCVKLNLRRSDSDLSSLDLNDLIEVEDEYFEIETDLNDTASFFSIDFPNTPKNDRNDDEFDVGSLDSERPTSTVASKHPERKKDKRPCCNLISIGDCFHDIESLKRLDLPLKDTVKKTIKLIGLPTANQLITQLKSIEKVLDRVIQLPKDVDLEVNRKVMKPLLSKG